MRTQFFGNTDINNEIHAYIRKTLDHLRNPNFTNTDSPATITAIIAEISQAGGLSSDQRLNVNAILR